MLLNRRSLFLGAALAGGVAYPFLVYFFYASLPGRIWAWLGLALIGLRLIAIPHNAHSGLWRAGFLVAAAALLLLSILDGRLAALAYPVIVSLSVASIFAFSLFFPPSIVERIARRSEPDLPPAGVLYCRNVTRIWGVFLICNATISASLALWGTVPQWTLWNGLLSYLLMGLLFAGEMIIRRRLRR